MSLGVLVTGKFLKAIKNLFFLVGNYLKVLLLTLTLAKMESFQYGYNNLNMACKQKIKPLSFIQL